MRKVLAVLVLVLASSTAFAQQSGPGVLPGNRPFSSGGPFTSPIYGPVSANCARPPYSFTGDNDTGVAQVAAGGANTVSVCIGGLERVRFDGDLQLRADAIRFGNTIGSPYVTLSALASAVLTSNSSIAFSAGGELRRTTSDASDNQSLSSCGGGACAATRGAFIDLYGNEAGSPGTINLQIGNVAAAKLSVKRSDGTEAFSVAGSNGATEAPVSMTSPFFFVGADSTTYIKRVGAQMYFGTNTNDAWLIEQAPPNFAPTDDNESGIGAKTRRPIFGYFKDELSLIGYAVGAREASGNIKQITEQVTLSGATTATTNMIPAGATVEGVAVTTTTTITGASGFQVGDGSDADRYGDKTGTAVGTNTDSADYTADPRWWTAAARAITLTAKTSNFTGGVVQVTVFYVMTTGS